MALAVYSWAGDQFNYMQYRWRSKMFVLPTETNYAYGRIILDENFYDDVIENRDIAEENAALFSGQILGALRFNTLRGITLRGDLLKRTGSYNVSPDVSLDIYVDGEIKASKTVSDIDSIFALPKGFTGKRIEIECTGFVPVKAIMIGPSIQELQTW